MKWKKEQSLDPNWKPKEKDEENRQELVRKIGSAKKRIAKIEASLQVSKKCLAHLQEVDAKYHIIEQEKKRSQSEPYEPLVSSTNNLLMCANKRLFIEFFTLIDN